MATLRGATVGLEPDEQLSSIFSPAGDEVYAERETSGDGLLECKTRLTRRNMQALLRDPRHELTPELLREILILLVEKYR